MFLAGLDGLDGDEGAGDDGSGMGETAYVGSRVDGAHRT